jgi:uncharacterized protein
MVSAPEFFRNITGFEWDEGNSAKNWQRHGVTRAEAEQVFLNRPLIVAADSRHSEREVRHFGLGQTDGARRLMVVFTIRGSRVRVISARPMSRTERRVYAQTRED